MLKKLLISFLLAILLVPLPIRSVIAQERCEITIQQVSKYEAGWHVLAVVDTKSLIKDKTYVLGLYYQVQVGPITPNDYTRVGTFTPPATGFIEYPFDIIRTDIASARLEVNALPFKDVGAVYCSKEVSLASSALCINQDAVNTAIGCIPIGDANELIAFILRWAIGIGGGIAFLLMVYAGFVIMTSTGNPERLKGGQELLTSAVAGLIMLIFSIFILRLIGINILQIPGFGGGGS